MRVRIFNRIELIARRISHQNINKSVFRVPRGCEPGTIHSQGNVFFVHIHLPKTGGTTFNTILEKNFGERYEPHIGRLVHEMPYFNHRQIEHYMEKHPGMRCISSHMFRAVLPYQSANRRIIAISIIRNPVDRFLSFYFHMRHRFGVDCAEKKYNLPEYIEVKKNRIKGSYMNGYLQKFCAEESEDAFRYIEQLVANENLFLFSTYQMNEATQLLQGKFPEVFMDISFAQENISLKDQTVTDEMREQVKKMISPFDWRLLDLAERKFNQSPNSRKWKKF